MPMNIQELYQIFLRHPVISTDTRQIASDSIFFALKGASFNGNEFAAQALEKGAAYVVVDETGLRDKGPSYIYVKDCLKTLQELATYHRRQLSIPIIGITGTNGKTTTKELVSAVLSRKYKLIYTLGNLNNHIGVPLTLLRLTKDHEIAVVEMGANHIGDIDELCKIAEPEYGIITNIGRAHLEGFGSPQGIIKTKSELYRHIKAHGKLVFVNADNDLLCALSEGMERVKYGESTSNFVSGHFKKANPFVELIWTKNNGNQNEIRTQLIGGYNTENILAACTIGSYFNVEEEDINKALEEYTPSNNRSQVIKKQSNTLIMDAYNANPTSMEAAIKSFAGMEHTNKWLILGDMLELGTDSQKEHQQLVDSIIAKGLMNVILVGPEFAKTNHSGYKSFSSTEEVKQYLEKQKLENALVLLKGSRGMKLETVAEIL